MVSPPFLQVEWSAVPGANAFWKPCDPTQPSPRRLWCRKISQTSVAWIGKSRKGVCANSTSGAKLSLLCTSARKLYGYDLTQAEDLIRGLRTLQ